MTTYTSGLRLSNQVTGANANTWGDIADTNFEHIDDALTGMVCCDITGASGPILTANNGSDDQARNMTLYIHGIPSSSNSVIIPAAQKMYLVRSSYTSIAGGITVRTNGGTGVNFSATDSGILYCDGVSVYSIAGSPDTVSALDPSNNLSDVAHASAARVNLGLQPEGTYIKTSGGVLELVITQILSAVWPIGSLYSNRTDATNPGTLFGIGTWASAGMGRILIGVGTGTDVNGATYTVTAESCGGEYSHVMTTAEMVIHSHEAGSLVAASAGEHSHNVKITGTGAAAPHTDNSGSTNADNLPTTSAGTHTHSITGRTSVIGSSSAFNVVQPWYSVYQWVRTA